MQSSTDSMLQRQQSGVKRDGGPPDAEQHPGKSPTAVVGVAVVAGHAGDRTACRTQDVSNTDGSTWLHESSGCRLQMNQFCGTTRRTQHPLQSRPPLLGSQLSRVSSMQVKPASHWMLAIPTAHGAECRQGRLLRVSGITRRTQHPLQSRPPLLGSQLSRVSSMQVKPASHWMLAIPPHMVHVSTGAGFLGLRDHQTHTAPAAVPAAVVGVAVVTGVVHAGETGVALDVGNTTAHGAECRQGQASWVSGITRRTQHPLQSRPPLLGSQLSRVSSMQVKPASHWMLSNTTAHGARVDNRGRLLRVLRDHQTHTAPAAVPATVVGVAVVTGVVHAGETGVALDVGNTHRTWCTCRQQGQASGRLRDHQTHTAPAAVPATVVGVAVVTGVVHAGETGVALDVSNTTAHGARVVNRGRLLRVSGITRRTQHPLQSRPPLLGSQLSRVSSMQVKPASHWMLAIPPHMVQSVDRGRQAWASSGITRRTQHPLQSRPPLLGSQLSRVSSMQVKPAVALDVSNTHRTWCTSRQRGQASGRRLLRDHQMHAAPAAVATTVVGVAVVTSVVDAGETGSRTGCWQYHRTWCRCRQG